MIGRWAMIVSGGTLLFSAAAEQPASRDIEREREPETTTPHQARPYSRDLDCADFNSWRAAQDTLDADPDDRHGLDADHDGIACEGLRNGSRF